jgi:hypothetical protein
MTPQRPPIRKSTSANSEETVSVSYVLIAIALTALGVFGTLSIYGTITSHEETGNTLVMPSILILMYQLGGKLLTVGCMGLVTVVFFLMGVFFTVMLIRQNRRAS